MGWGHLATLAIAGFKYCVEVYLLFIEVRMPWGILTTLNTSELECFCLEIFEIRN